MYTTCPNCETQLTVTVAGLRVGRGFVRCSRCQDVFNAVLALAEDGEGNEAATDASPGAAVDRQPAPADSEFVDTGTYQTIVLEGNAILQTEEIAPVEEIEAQIKEIAEQVEATPEPADDGDETPTFDLDEDELDGQDYEHAVLRDDEPPLPPVSSLRDTIDTEVPKQFWPTGDPASLLGAPSRAARASHRGPWIVGAALAVVAAALGLVHAFRQDLAQQPWAARPLTRLYDLLHMPLQPPWDVTAYEVRQLGAEVASDAAAPRITVRASVHNHAPRAQPAPMLRITLQDPFGLQLTTRVVGPEEYLRDTPQPTLAPDMRRDITFTLPDPGQNAVGFEIDACLRNAAGQLRCAGDRPTR